MANNMINTELTHSNGTSVTFTFADMDGFIAATVEARLAPRTVRVHLNAANMMGVLNAIEENAVWGIADIDEAVADLTFELRHFLRFSQMAMMNSLGV